MGSQGMISVFPPAIPQPRVASFVRRTIPVR